MHVETLRALVAQLAARLDAVDTYGAPGARGCPVCHQGEARAFLADLRHMLAEAGETQPRGDTRTPAPGGPRPRPRRGA